MRIKDQIIVIVCSFGGDIRWCEEMIRGMNWKFNLMWH